MHRSSVPDSVPESAGELLTRIHEAVRRGDAAAERRRTTRLHRAVQALANRQRVPLQLVGEVCQSVLLDVHRVMRAGTFDQVRDPSAWLAQVLRNACLDHIRARSRAARRFVPLHDLDPEADMSGVHRIDRLVADADAWLARAEGFVASYAAQASARGSALAGTHVQVWFELRVRMRDAAEIARDFGVADRADGGRQTVHQWAHRGAVLLSRLVADDADQARAAAIEVLLAGAA